MFFKKHWQEIFVISHGTEWHLVVQKILGKIGKQFGNVTVQNDRKIIRKDLWRSLASPSQIQGNILKVAVRRH